MSGCMLWLTLMPGLFMPSIGIDQLRFSIRPELQVCLLK